MERRGSLPLAEASYISLFEDLEGNGNSRDGI